MSWNLKWYYFGDLVTLTEEGADACLTSANIKDGELVDDLHSMCPNQVELGDILKGKKQNDEPIIFDRIRNLPSISSRKSLWQKQLNMDLMICDMPGHRPQVLVGLDQIVLPWPFPVDVKKRDSKLKKCIDFTRKSLPKELLKISPWMHTVEELLYEPDGNRYLNEFKRVGNCSAIVEFAWEKRKRDLIVPSYFDAVPDTSITPIEIFIKQAYDEDEKKEKMKLHVGVKGVKGVAADREDPHALFEKWPCGAS